MVLLLGLPIQDGLDRSLNIVHDSILTLREIDDGELLSRRSSVFMLRICCDIDRPQTVDWLWSSEL